VNGVFAQEQSQQGGYHSVACVKVRDGKMAEYREFLGESHKLGQALANSGRMTVGLRLRSIMPAGEAAMCDFVFVSEYKGIPPKPQGPDELGAYLQKAGISMSAAEFVAKRSSLTKLVASEIDQTVIGVGKIEKGDYAYVNHMKVHDMANWMELERSIWKPMAEAWVKSGVLRGWFVIHPVLPGGTDLRYQGITVDVMPNWEAAFTPPPIEKTFKQIHSDKDLKEISEKIEKSRDLALRELLVVEEKIVPSGTATRGGTH
jgi:hypothetical protein